MLFDDEVLCCVNSFARLVCAGSRSASASAVSVLTAEARLAQLHRDWTVMASWAGMSTASRPPDIKNALKRLRGHPVVSRVVCCLNNQNVEVFGPKSRVVVLSDADAEVLGLLRSGFPTSTSSNKLVNVQRARRKLLWIPEAAGFEHGLSPMLPRGAASVPHARLSVGAIEDRIQKAALGSNEALLCASGLMSAGTVLQCPHVDFSPKELRRVDAQVAFLPLCKQGMFLHVWPQAGKGLVAFVPFGRVLILDAHTVHAGAFKIPGSLTPRIQIKIFPDGDLLQPGGNCHQDELGRPLSDFHIHDSELADQLLEIGIMEN